MRVCICKYVIRYRYSSRHYNITIRITVRAEVQLVGDEVHYLIDVRLCSMGFVVLRGGKVSLSLPVQNAPAGSQDAQGRCRHDPTITPRTRTPLLSRLFTVPTA